MQSLHISTYLLLFLITNFSYLQPHCYAYMCDNPQAHFTYLHICIYVHVYTPLCFQLFHLKNLQSICCSSKFVCNIPSLTGGLCAITDGLQTVNSVYIYWGSISDAGDVLYSFYVALF